MALTIVSMYPVDDVKQVPNHFVRGANGNHITWCENKAEALEHASAAAADTFMTGKWSLPYVKTSVNGVVNYSKKQHD